MKKKFSAKMAIALFVGAALTVSLTTRTLADGGHSHGQQDNAMQNKSNDTKGMDNMMGDGHGHGQETDHHSHDNWATPPAAYANKQSNRWVDLAAVERGKAIYQQQCAMCHGADGQGTGPMGKALEHQPADLTNHFHERPGDGDAYLFWRVSKGGTVEPFRSQDSAMPAFETVLSEAQRWDVLAYVHTFFHMGLGEWENGDESD